MGVATTPLAAPAAAATARCEQLFLTAAVDVGAGSVTGNLRCKVAVGGPLWLGDYAELLDQAQNLDEQGLLREYPDGFSPAKGAAYAVSRAPRDRAGERGPVCLGALGAPEQAADAPFWRSYGEVLAGDEVTVAFHRPLPNRQGTFGRRHRVAYLLAGWMPVFAGDAAPAEGGTSGADADAPGRRPSRPYAVALPIRYRIALPAGHVAVVGRTPVGLGHARWVQGSHVGTTVPVVVAPAAHVHTCAAGVLWVPEDGHGHVAGHDDVTAFRDGAAHQQALKAMVLANGAWAQTRVAAGASPAAAPPSLLVQVPLRLQLAEAFEGGVAISDRAFHLPIWPLAGTVQRMHQASLWRELLAEQARRHLLPHNQAGDLPLWVSADAVGCAVRARLLAACGGVTYTAELLDQAVVSPELDALVYAPQVAFADTYTDAVDESPRSARRFDVASSSSPRGKLLFEKARDLVGTAQAIRAFAGALHLPADGRSDVAAYLRTTPLQDAVPELLAWLGPYPPHDYALGACDRISPTTVRLQLDQRDGAPVVAKDAAAWSAAPAAGPGKTHDPVDVLVVEAVDAHGERHRARRFGPGPLLLTGVLPFRSLQLDPQHRLSEHTYAPRLQPGLNNRRPARWRLLLNDVSVLLSATDFALAASVDVGLRRIYDLRFDYDFAAAVGPGTLALQASAAWHFGELITPLRLADSLALTLGTTRLRAESGLPSEGQQVAMAVNLQRDTRLSRYSALRGYGLRAQASVGTRVEGGRNHGPYGNLGAAGLGLWPLGGRQALVGRLRGDWSWGPVPAQTMLRLGGRYMGARGFEMSEARGTRRALASAEWRHVLLGDARTDLWGLATFSRMEGALFADAAYLPVRLPQSCHKRLFYDVGYGVRFLADVFGVSPASLAIDVGLPLGRCPAWTGGRRPVTVYVDFVQSFSSF